MERIGVALVGAGYWGPNLARAARRVDAAELALICDVSETRRKQMEVDFRGVPVVSDFDSVLSDRRVDAVLLATPPPTHHPLARLTMESGRHVLVEKPLGTTVEQCEDLRMLADAKGCVLMVGHTFLYSEAVRELRRRVRSDHSGQPYYASSRRLNMGKVRSDINCLWNFAPHDLSILDFLFDAMPEQVTATAGSFLQPSVEDVVFLGLQYDSGFVAHVELSWLSPVKVRQMVVVCSERMFVYDDTSVDAPLSIHERAFSRKRSAVPYSDFGEYQLTQRQGDIVLPHVPPKEPLVTEMEEFVAAICSGNVPVADGAHATRVVAVLEAADQALRSRRQVPVTLP